MTERTHVAIAQPIPTPSATPMMVISAASNIVRIAILLGGTPSDIAIPMSNVYEAGAGEISNGKTSKRCCSLAISS